MATSSFISRWSQRKLEEASNHHEDNLNTTEQSDLEVTQTEAASLNLDETSIGQADTKHSTDEDAKPEEMSIANLLVSEVSESVKKAALRKLFLSEEFNVRDGLDDYDDDYSNLKSMSEGVAETLRDWIKEKSDEEISIDEAPLTVREEEPVLVGIDESEQESAESPQDNEELYIKTVSSESSTAGQLPASEQLGQNLPQEK